MLKRIGLIYRRYMPNILQTLMDFVMIYSCATESVSIAIRTEPFSAMCVSFVFNTREGQYIYIHVRWTHLILSLILNYFGINRFQIIPGMSTVSIFDDTTTVAVTYIKAGQQLSICNYSVFQYII